MNPRPWDSFHVTENGAGLGTKLLVVGMKPYIARYTEETNTVQFNIHAGTSREQKKSLSHPRLSDCELEVGQAEPGDREATRLPKKKRLSHPRLSDREQEVGQAEPGDREATQGATRSPKKRLSHPRLSDREQAAKQSQVTEKPLK